MMNPCIACRSAWFVLIALFFIFSKPHCIYSQKPGSETGIMPVGKNSIKGFTYNGAIPFTFAINGISAGYERTIAGQQVIELTGYYKFQIYSEMGHKGTSYCVMPGYRYSVTSPKRFINHTWLGLYLIYYNRTHWGGDEWDGEYNMNYHNGIGASLGRKIYLSPHWFFDIGVGASYNLFNIKPNTSYDTEATYFIPRFILHFGGTF